MSDYQPTPPQATPYTAGPLQPTERYNVLAIVSLVLAFFVSLGAVICGHIALSQISRTGEKGRGLAIAGLVLGYLGIVAGLIIGIWFVVLFVTALNAGYTTYAP